MTVQKGSPVSRVVVCPQDSGAQPPAQDRAGAGQDGRAGRQGRTAEQDGRAGRQGRTAGQGHNLLAVP